MRGVIVLFAVQNNMWLLLGSESEVEVAIAKLEKELAKKKCPTSRPNVKTFSFQHKETATTDFV